MQVTALETVFSDGPNGTYSCVLSQHLMCFCGILAAGTRCGHIYLIGMQCILSPTYNLSVVLLRGVDQFTVLVSRPHLVCDVGLEEGECRKTLSLCYSIVYHYNVA